MHDSPVPNPVPEPALTSSQVQIPQPKTKFPIVYIALSLLTIVLLVSTAFLYYQNMQLKNMVASYQSQPVVSPTPIATTDPTADWKTYKNVALGFELKYPTIVEIDREFNDQNNRAAIFKGDNLYFEVMLRKAGDISLDKYYYMDNSGFTKSILGSKNANVYIYDASKNSCVSDGNGPSCPLSYVTYVVLNGSDLYHLSFYGDSTLSNVEKEILSTFKFTN